MRRYSIQTKIVLPFLILFVLITILVSMLTVEFFAWKYSEQFTRETEGWFNVIIETGFIDEDIQKVKQAYSVEVMIFSSDFTINASTLTDIPEVEQDAKYLAEKMRLREVQQSFQEEAGTPVTHNVSLGGKHYEVFYHILAVGRIYCLLRPMDEIAAAKRTLTLYMFGIAILVTGLVSFISHRIGKTITDPIQDLVGFTNKVAEGNLDEQCELRTHDEIGDLATAFNQMTQELKQSRDKLIQAERLATAGKMATSFAHEIRNPLSSMRMLSQLLRQKPELTEEQRQSLQYILEEIERIDTIVKGMMDFARPTSLKPVQQPLEPLLRDVLALMQANLTHHKIELQFELTADLPEFEFDSDKIKQAFMNVVLNSMEAMPQGGVLTVSTSNMDNGVSIEVADTGVGIPETDIPHLFEPFFTSQDKGTGLGLANVKRIIEEHGGTVAIESTLDEGVTVSIWLPLRYSTGV